MVKNIVTVKVKDVLKIPGVMLDSICTVATSISMGFLAATLEPHIREVTTYSIYQFSDT